MKSLTVLFERQPGERSYTILDRSRMIDGNPLERFRRGDDGVLQCLIEVYGIDPDTASTIVLESKTRGSADITIG
jgi:hypothetical protein